MFSILRLGSKVRWLVFGLKVRWLELSLGLKAAYLSGRVVLMSPRQEKLHQQEASLHHRRLEDVENIQLHQLGP